MEDFKTKEVSENAIEHLLEIGYVRLDELSELLDSPYILFKDGVLQKTSSRKAYNNYSVKEKTHTQILKLRKPIDKVKKEKMSYVEKAANDLLSILNKSPNLLGYEVIFNIQEYEAFPGSYNIFPITPTASGSISIDHAKKVIEFADKNLDVQLSFGYTDWCDQKKKYGTSYPCIHVL